MTATIGWDEGLKGAYSTILDLIYINQGRLPDENAYISVHIGCTKNKWTMTYREQLLERGKIEIIDGFIMNPRASEVIVEAGYERPENKSSAKPTENLRKTSAKPRQKQSNFLPQKPHKTEDFEQQEERREDKSIIVESNGRKNEPEISGKKVSEWKEIRSACIDAAKPMLSESVLATIDIREIRNWMNADPPCRLHEDIIPTLQAMASNPRAKQEITTWKYFTNAVTRTRDERLQGLPKPRNRENERNSKNTKRGSKAYSNQASRNRQKSSGLAGAIERRLTQGEEPIDESIINVTPRRSGGNKHLRISHDTDASALRDESDS